MTNIVLNKKEFIKTLSVGGMFAGKRGKVLPILDCVKIKVSGGRINIVSSDNENAINKRMDVVEANGDCTFCVDYKDLLSYVKLVSGENVTLCVGDSEVTIKHEKGEMNIPLFNADEFPTIEPDKEGVKVTLDSALLNNWIVDARSFVGDDVLRPTITGIYFYSKGGEVGCCGTDTMLLFTDYVNADIENFEFILNKGAFAAVCGACADTDKVTMKIGNNNVLFVGNDMSVLARRTEGRFPNFKMVIPKNNNIKATANKSELVDAIKRCRLGADKGSFLLKLEFSGMNLQITGQDYDFNRKATENVMVQTDGNVTIGFNAEQLLKVLESIQTENVVFELKNESTACVVREDNDSNKTLLIVPMMIR